MIEKTVIGRAIEYVNEYLKSYNQITAYKAICDPDTSESSINGNASRYHMSPAVTEAFTKVLSEVQGFNTKDEAAAHLTKRLDDVQDDPKEFRAYLESIAKLKGWTDKAASVQVTQVQATQQLSEAQEQAIVNRINS